MLKVANDIQGNHVVEIPTVIVCDLNVFELLEDTNGSYDVIDEVVGEYAGDNDQGKEQVLHVEAVDVD